ncbi:LacI family DNA-binding transcriptional regulator [Maritimibacter sp. UBA3975]|uniref:LacI family DNA-binding transcriptional regulator n=1 Tax=Maritimibacter sp. UBA3975 TaxID=1946833 RepID=UPI000C0A43ED|nr:LacI family DNA-binding transcriptional regulator [Maritimibacter sp. UBA3975]MAM62894.1 LacI family transcriptional regulator [Maritimibacter sp.]|tara:strand:+ start:31801 stop:32862 length:1062 start_codon:yes stop_codon:yes gene_type:complete
MDGKLPTLTDVARRAGVSYATADRVVNGRGRVAEKSSRRVLEAIEALGYVRNVAAANLAQQRIYRFAVILPDGQNAFFARMRAILAETRDRLLPERFDLRVDTVPAFDSATLASHLDGLADADIDGVAVVGTEGPEVAAAAERLAGAGVHLLTLVSDMTAADRAAYVGIDNVVAGRTAGRMILMAHAGRPGRVLPVLGALSARDHADRLSGLRAVLADGPQLSLAPEIEGRDSSEIVERKMRDALTADPTITAIYNAGAGNAGLVRALAARPADRPRPFVVLHELVAHTRAALETGQIDMVLDQRPEEAVRRVVATLRALADRRPAEKLEPILPTIFVKDNLPPQPGPADTGD